MRNEPGLPVLLDRAPVSDGRSETFAPVGERRAYAAPGESLTFAVLTRAGRELIVTLTTQPVFDLALSAPVARRIRRTVRHRGGESALTSLARRTLEPGDLESIDLQTLGKGRDLLRLGAHDSGVLPAFWRTVAAGGGYAPACVELQNQIAPAALLVEIMGGIEHAPPEAVRSAMAQFGSRSAALILHIAPDPAAAWRLAPVRAQCLLIDFAGVEHEHARDWGAAAQLIGAARQACPQVMLLNLRPDRGLAAQAAGATHAVFAGMQAVTI